MVKPVTLIIGAVVCFIIAALGQFVFPGFFKSQIKKAKQLKKGNQMRRDWAVTPLAVDFKIYLFNVTNYKDVEQGSKPTVQEVGPFFYREWKSKANLQDDPDEDTVSFQMQNVFYFDKKESKPLTGDEVIYMPHIMILAFAELTLQTKPGALNMINKAIPHIFNNPTSIFVKTTPQELLWDGMVVNCTKSKEFAANTVCDEIRKNAAALKSEDDGTFKFSLFGMKNGTPDANVLTVKRGIKNIQEVGQVVLYNGKPEMDFWSGMPCNQIKGTDTTIFAPFMEPTDEIWAFGAEICRSLSTKFVEHATYKGIHGYYHESDLGDMSTDPDLKCFCPTNTTCLKKGAFDLTRCVGVPLIATLPHCYLCHPEYLNSVNGLSPSKEKHAIFALYEPVTGVPVSGRRRLQFNMWFHRIPKITIMKTLPEEPILLPLFWVEEGVALNDTLSAKFRHLLYRPVKIVKITTLVMLASGIFMITGAIFVFYSRAKLKENSSSEDTKTTITQVSPAY